MTNGEANMVNTVLSYLVGRRYSQLQPRPTVDEALDAAAWLADRACKAISAGWWGDRFRAAWPEGGGFTPHSELADLLATAFETYGSGCYHNDELTCSQCLADVAISTMQEGRVR